MICSPQFWLINYASCSRLVARCVCLLTNDDVSSAMISHVDMLHNCCLIASKINKYLFSRLPFRAGWCLYVAIVFHIASTDIFFAVKILRRLFEELEWKQNQYYTKGKPTLIYFSRLGHANNILRSSLLLFHLGWVYGGRTELVNSFSYSFLPMDLPSFLH